MEGHHHHAHAEGINYNKAFAWGVLLNIVYVIAECVYGFRINSLALLSDAGHNFGDVLSLLLAWGAEYLLSRKAFGQYTYGLKRSSILIAFANTLLLVLPMGIIAWEAVNRFAAPVQSEGLTMSLVALIGIAVNGFTAFLFYQNTSKDLNIRSAFWHMLGDALVSAGVVLAGLLIYFTHLYWIDPLVSLVIVMVIVAGTWGILKDTVRLVLDAAPADIPVGKVKKYLESISGVQAIHDLHIWNLSTRQTALTVHLIVPGYQQNDAFLRNIEHELHHQFEITHVTIQIESKEANCELAHKKC